MDSPGKSNTLYLDYAASTPLHPEALQEMLSLLSGTGGNPSSTHSFGRRARGCIDLARDRVAALLEAESSEITFTSGGTESDNLAIFGAALNAPPDRRRVVVSASEHHAILNPAHRLAEMGFDVQFIPILPSGEIDLDAASQLIDETTALVSVMLVNNETGVIQPVKKIVRLAERVGALVHTDAIQAALFNFCKPKDLGVSLLSISAHKFYGPVGAGALWVRRGVKLKPVLYGGAQERQRRAGTENLPALAGMGKAAELTLQHREDWLRAATSSAEAFSKTAGSSDYCIQNAAQARRIPTILNYHLPGVDAELLTMRMDNLGVAISTGSACASGSLEPSHVLLAMGMSEAEARSCIRVSFGRESSPDTSAQAAELILTEAGRMRSRTSSLGVF